MDLAIIGKMKILKNKRSKNKKLNKSLLCQRHAFGEEKKMNILVTYFSASGITI